MSKTHFFTGYSNDYRRCTATDSVRSILEIELGQMMARHSVGKGIIDAAGGAAPAFGMIGTLIGLVLMLQNLDDPSALGPGMAVALVTTFYGAVIANAVFIPVAGNLAKEIKKRFLLDRSLLKAYWRSRRAKSQCDSRAFERILTTA